jgi:hypothetical protein
MDRILFGDNQFFMSETKARAQSLQFADTASIISVLDFAFDQGLRTFMCTTHDRIGEVADHMRLNPHRYADYRFYPGMPYAHKYANAISELGMLGALREYSADGVVETVFKGARGVFRKDADRLMRMLVDAEMKRFTGLNTPVIFLQNVVTDLLLGLGMYEMFALFHEYVRVAYNAEAGFITMNMPALLVALASVEIANPIVCCNYNKIGFRMSGGVGAYEDALTNRTFRCIAMSVLASGAIEADEAIEWICERPNIVSIVFGASSESNIRQTIGLINKYSASRPV